MKSLRELLTGRAVITLPASTTVLEASIAMQAQKVGAVLVSEDDGTGAIGIFTERDLMSRVVAAELDPARTALRQVMTADMVTAGPDDRVAAVTQLLQDRHIRHLPVVENGTVIGLVGLRDLLRELLSHSNSEVRALTDYIHGTDELPHS